MNLVSLQAQRYLRLSPPNIAVSAKIGPNAVIQSLRALQALEKAPLTDTIIATARLNEREPSTMVDEDEFVRLVAAIRAYLPADRAASVLGRAGTYTADYVAANRIPAIFRSLLERLPARLAIPLLLRAFRRHAWTFAGSSHFEVTGSYPREILLDDAPTCRAGNCGGSSGEYYAAAFQGLLSLASPDVRVGEVECRCSGAGVCRFAIQTTRDPLRG